MTGTRADLAAYVMAVCPMPAAAPAAPEDDAAVIEPFCGDADGVICFTTDGSMPKVTPDGRCPWETKDGKPAGCAVLQ
jgi:hypothetical protein